jgi:hypothetical protein
LTVTGHHHFTAPADAQDGCGTYSFFHVGWILNFSRDSVAMRWSLTHMVQRFDFGLQLSRISIENTGFVARGSSGHSRRSGGFTGVFREGNRRYLPNPQDCIRHA